MYGRLVPLWMPNMVRVPRAGTLLITLPSDSSSQRTPLRLANGWQLPASVADFHRQITRHAWRTTKKGPPKDMGGLSICYRRYYAFFLNGPPNALMGFWVSFRVYSIIGPVATTPRMVPMPTTPPIKKPSRVKTHPNQSVYTSGIFCSIYHE